MSIRLVACAFLLAGCSNVWVPPPSVDDAQVNQENVWVPPPGVDEAQVKQDVSACRVEAFSTPIVPESIFVGAYPSADPTQGLSNVARRDHIEDTCMESRGYRKQ